MIQQIYNRPNSLLTRCRPFASFLRAQVDLLDRDPMLADVKNKMPRPANLASEKAKKLALFDMLSVTVLRLDRICPAEAGEPRRLPPRAIFIRGRSPSPGAATLHPEQSELLRRTSSTTLQDAPASRGRSRASKDVRLSRQECVQEGVPPRRTFTAPVESSSSSARRISPARADFSATLGPATRAQLFSPSRDARSISPGNIFPASSSLPPRCPRNLLPRTTSSSLPKRAPGKVDPYVDRFMDLVEPTSGMNRAPGGRGFLSKSWVIASSVVQGWGEKVGLTSPASPQDGSDGGGGEQEARTTTSRRRRAYNALKANIPEKLLEKLPKNIPSRVLGFLKKPQIMLEGGAVFVSVKLEQRGNSVAKDAANFIMHSDSVQDVVNILLGKSRLLNWRVKKMFELQMSIILDKVIAEFIPFVRDLNDAVAFVLYKLSLDFETAWLGLFAQPDSDTLILEGRPAEFRLDEMVTLHTLKRHLVCKGCRNTAVTFAATIFGTCTAVAGLAVGNACGVLSLPAVLASFPAFLGFTYLHAKWGNVATIGAEQSRGRPYHLGSSLDVVHSKLPPRLQAVLPSPMIRRFTPKVISEGETARAKLEQASAQLQEVETDLGTDIGALPAVDAMRERMEEDLANKAAGKVVLYAPSGGEGFYREICFQGPQRKLETIQTMDRYKFCKWGGSWKRGDHFQLGRIF